MYIITKKIQASNSTLNESDYPMFQFYGLISKLTEFQVSKTDRRITLGHINTRCKLTVKTCPYN